MKRWIVIRNSDNLPVRRPGNSKQYETFEDEFDPNILSKFGQNETYRFVEVIIEEDPVFDPNIEELIQVTTTGLNGEVFRGELDNLNWVLRKVISPMSLADVKRYRKSLLSSDMNDRLNNGYIRSGRVLNLDQSTFSMLSNLLHYAKAAVEKGDMVLTDKLVFNDRDDLAVIVTPVQLRNLFVSYGALIQSINEEYERTIRALKLAGNNTEVLAITWSFPI